MFTPYLGGGLGWANVEFDDGAKDDDNVFAYQVGGGLALEMMPLVTFDLGYRYFGTADPNIFGADVDYDSHNIMAGVRIGF